MSTCPWSIWICLVEWHKIEGSNNFIGVLRVMLSHRRQRASYRHYFREGAQYLVKLQRATLPFMNTLQADIDKREPHRKTSTTLPTSWYQLTVNYSYIHPILAECQREDKTRRSGTTLCQRFQNTSRKFEAITELTIKTRSGEAMVNSHSPIGCYIGSSSHRLQYDDSSRFQRSDHNGRGSSGGKKKETHVSFSRRSKALKPFRGDRTIDMAPRGRKIRVRTLNRCKYAALKLTTRRSIMRGQHTLGQHFIPRSTNWTESRHFDRYTQSASI